MPESAISPRNLVDKLCFLRFGAGIEDHKEAFKSELYTFLRGKAQKDVTRQAIKYWLEGRNSAPTRDPALRFLHDYFDATVVRAALPLPAQKQVYDQVVVFFKRHESVLFENVNDEHPTTKLSLSLNRRVMVDIPQQWDELSRLSANITGWHRLLHVQLDDNMERPVTSEVLEIFFRGRELRFRLHVPGGTERAIITGIVMIVGRAIWFVGSSNAGIPRMRILTLRHIESAEARYNALRWGIMTTDMPRPSSPDPVACRFVLWKEESAVEDRYEYVRKHVKHLTRSETEVEPLKSLMRVILNNITALSDGHSPDPLLRAGSPIMDEPLKVNQATIELVAEKIAGIL
jgi:hypothetical protein